MRGGKALNRKQEEDTSSGGGRVTRVSFSIKANLGLSFYKMGFYNMGLVVWVFIFMGFSK